MQRLLPEWAPQWGVMIAWPHEATDWEPQLHEAEQTYLALACAILDQAQLLVLCRDASHEDHIMALLGSAGADLKRVHLRQLPYNDTWARDFGPLTVMTGSGLKLLDFTFNGWGNKFRAEDDNAVSSHLDWAVARERQDLVLEGGSIEINSDGWLLTTGHCLLNPNRNPSMSQARIEQALRETLGATEFLWLHHGHLEGDDTDAHIDTLARFCDDRTIAYVHCDDEHDSHFTALDKMREELEGLAQRYALNLIPLPMAEATFDTDGERLPATYANFLILNGAVLVPTYGTDRDQQALTQVQKACPDKRIIGVPCLPLVHQHGSLHCVTMQLPEGVL